MRFVAALIVASLSSVGESATTTAAANTGTTTAPNTAAPTTTATPTTAAATANCNAPGTLQNTRAVACCNTWLSSLSPAAAFENAVSGFQCAGIGAVDCCCGPNANCSALACLITDTVTVDDDDDAYGWNDDVVVPLPPSNEISVDNWLKCINVERNDGNGSTTGFWIWIVVVIAIGVCCWGGTRRGTTFRRYDAARGAGAYDGNRMRYATPTYATRSPYMAPPGQVKQQFAAGAMPVAQPQPYAGLPTVSANPIHVPSSE